MTIHPKHLILILQLFALSWVPRKHSAQSKSWLNHKDPEANPRAVRQGVQSELWAIRLCLMWGLLAISSFMQDSSFKKGSDKMNPSGTCTVASTSGYRTNPRSGRGHLFPKCHFQIFYFSRHTQEAFSAMVDLL